MTAVAGFVLGAIYGGAMALAYVAAIDAFGLLVVVSAVSAAAYGLWLLFMPEDVDA